MDRETAINPTIKNSCGVTVKLNKKNTYVINTNKVLIADNEAARKKTIQTESVVKKKHNTCFGEHFKMRFFRKIEVAKPKKNERASSECLGNDVIKPLENSAGKIECELKNNLVKQNLQRKVSGVINEGYDAQNEKEEPHGDNGCGGIKEQSHQSGETGEEIDKISEENLANVDMKEKSLDNVNEKKNNIPEVSNKQHSTWQKVYWRIEKILNFPHFIHWVTLCLIGLAIWSIIYSIANSGFLPDSQLFSLLFLFVLAYVGGELISLIKLPPLMGMLLVGLLFRNVGFIHLSGVYMEVTAILREMALCIILIRAGLGLDPKALKSLSLVILRLASVPGIVEGILTTVVTHFLLGLPWLWGVLTGSILAAVSPAVVIPCLFSLQERGYGKGKGIPTLVVAAASLDDIFAITVFGVILNVVFAPGTNLTMHILQGPLGIALGVAFGIIWGFVSHFVPHQKDDQVVLLRVLMIAGGGFMAIVGSRGIGYQGAGPLGCIIAAFVACLGWRRQDYCDGHNPVADVFKIIWLIFQPILFGLVGSEVDVSIIEFSTLGNGLLALFCSLLGRMVVTVFIGFGAGFNWKEKTFIALGWFPKATVQAALGPLVLDTARRHGTEDDTNYARKVLILAVLSILITAPIGAALITTLGPKLLSKLDSKPREDEVEDVGLRCTREESSKD